MFRYPISLHRFFPNFLYVLAMPLFFLFSALLYEPAGLEGLLGAGEGISRVQDVRSFNLVMTATILLGSMLLTRLPFYFLRKTLRMGLGKYTLWCLGELLLLSAFAALYLTLMARGGHGYFYYLARCASCLLSLLAYPYLILTLFWGWHDAACTEPLSEGARLRFHDSRHQLKFITTAAAILYIEANENYILIHYLENGLEKTCQIRNSMKNVEPLCAQAGFVRTHRRFIVNPAHIKSIRRDESGIHMAELGAPEGGKIPVSKTYYEALAACL